MLTEWRREPLVPIMLTKKLVPGVKLGTNTDRVAFAEEFAVRVTCDGVIPGGMPTNAETVRETGPAKPLRLVTVIVENTGIDEDAGIDRKPGFARKAKSAADIAIVKRVLAELFDRFVSRRSVTMASTSYTPGDRPFVWSVLVKTWMPWLEIIRFV